VASPWNILIVVAAFFTLTFAAHASIQPRKQRNLIGDIATGVTIPPMLLLLSIVVLGEQLDARVMVTLGLGICAISLFVNRARPLVMSGLVLLAFAIIFMNNARDMRVLHQHRSFFGVLRTIVYEQPEGSNLPDLRVLMHGTTIHGAQLVGGVLSRQPLTYYHQDTALGEAILAGLSTKEEANVALIGLGAGSTACLTRPRDHLVIFEIDPTVVRLSNSSSGDFTFVPECQPNARVELGDARLQIAEEPNGEFDVIVVDAFSSDAIPAHLLTREALQLYLDKASDRGVVILHLSNRNLALVSEAGRVAASLGAHTMWRASSELDFPLAPVYGALGASVMIVARNPAAFAGLPLQATDWKVLPVPPGRPWTDDYINLPRALWDQLSGVEECRLYPFVPRCLPPEERSAAEQGG